jgi:hypothetical protein
MQYSISFFSFSFSFSFFFFRKKETACRTVLTVWEAIGATRVVHAPQDKIRIVIHSISYLSSFSLGKSKAVSSQKKKEAKALLLLSSPSAVNKHTTSDPDTVKRYHFLYKKPLLLSFQIINRFDFFRNPRAMMTATRNCSSKQGRPAMIGDVDFNLHARGLRPKARVNQLH